MPRPASAQVTITDLGTLGGSYNYAQGINDLGQIVGHSTTDSAVTHAFVWSATAGMVDLGTLLGGLHSFASGINDLGQVVGYGAWASAHPAPEAGRGRLGLALRTVLKDAAMRAKA